MKVRVSKKLKGELYIDAIGFSLKAGQVIELTQDQEKSQNIITSINKGFLVDVRKDEAKDKEQIAEIKEPKRKVKLTELNKIEETEETKNAEEVEEIEIKEQPTDMAAFNMETQELLDKEKSTKTAMDRIGSMEMEPVQSGDVDFTDSTVEPEQEVKEPKKTKKAKKAKKAKKTKKTRKKTTKKKSAAKVRQKLKEAAKKISETKSIKPVGNKKEEPVADLVYDNSDTSDISFVDQEQEQERLNKRQELFQNENDLF